MSEIKDGGPAFPIADPFALDPRDKIEMERLASGMSLRDYFAAKAMQGICAHPNAWGLTVPQIAERAYLLADAMLRARGEA
ncbi:hypothetical protein AQ764_14325 [Burkholderia pseudomallei]|uniref:hypothetical protein n=1 Tax=Burkholderia pseudomallei TaxID=28450 RepID=UPI000977D3E9|nr:hypothetical protein [Burkholderia pseudomallei]OMT68750.1 hypothetical protein AQ764_14325 [Burkholderia pseudomallei]